MRIWKVEFTLSDVVKIMMPPGAILHVDVQKGRLCMWFMVDDRGLTNRQFRVFGTGHEFDPKGLEYVATFQDEPFVWHVFEVVE